MKQESNDRTALPVKTGRLLTEVRRGIFRAALFSGAVSLLLVPAALFAADPAPQLQYAPVPEPGLIADSAPAAEADPDPLFVDSPEEPAPAGFAIEEDSGRNLPEPPGSAAAGGDADPDDLFTDGPLDGEESGGEPAAEEEPVPEPVDRRAELLEQMSEGELDSRFELFAEFEPTAQWSAAVEGQLRDTFPLLEQNPAAARAALRRLSGQIVQDDFTETALMTDEEARQTAKRDRWGNGRSGEGDFHLASSSEKYASRDEGESGPAGTLIQCSPEERAAMMRAFRHSLDRRVFLWTAAADYFENSPVQQAAAPEITPKEIALLKERTLAVRNYFGITPAGRRWRKNFEIDELYNAVLKAEEENDAGHSRFQPYLTGGLAAQEKGGRENLDHIREHINSITSKIESPALNEAQKEVFRHAAPKQWYRLLRSLAADQSDPYEILALYEEYERLGGGDTGRALARAARRMSNSPSAASRQMGDAVSTIYDNPNLKVYISQAFINRFLPIRDPEFDVVQEKILGNPVAGSRRTDTQVRIQLVPDPKRLLMNLVVTGRIVASTKSEVFPAKIFNESYANYAGIKQLEWGSRGMSWSESKIDVNNTNLLSDVRTNIDFVPILGGLTREMVKDGYQSRQEELRQETREKIEGEVRRRIDTESTERFELMNRRLADNFYTRLEELGLNLSLQDSRTTDDWLLASMRLSESASLGGQTAEPPTLRGAFADLKVHESALNVFLSRLELGGRSWTPPEIAEHLAGKFRREAPKLEYDSNLWVEFEFCETDPVTVQFLENQIKVRLRFNYIDLGDQSWDDVEAAVTYVAETGEDGVPCLTRGGVISISGPMNIRAQIPLRGFFSKIFAPETRIPLRPKLFDRDERFAGLSTGLCRISNGWFAVSVVEEADLAAAEEYPRLKSLRERFAQKPRIGAALR